MKNGKKIIEDIAGSLCSALTDLGCEFYWEGDNRGGKHTSKYIFVRKPVAMKIRVSDHRSDRAEKDKQKRVKTFDVGPHSQSWQDAIAEIGSILSSTPTE